MSRVSAAPVTKKSGEVLRVGVDFTLYGLLTAELLTGTVTLDVPSGITASATGTGLGVNTAVFNNSRGKEVAVGKGVIILVSGGTDGEDYEIGVSCGTNGTPAQTLDGNCPVEVRDSN